MDEVVGSGYCAVVIFNVLAFVLAATAYAFGISISIYCAVVVIVLESTAVFTCNCPVEPCGRRNFGFDGKVI